MTYFSLTQFLFLQTKKSRGWPTVRLRSPSTWSRASRRRLWRGTSPSSPTTSKWFTSTSPRCGDLFFSFLKLKRDFNRKRLQEPGELFQAGYHDITYVAQDASGNQAKCQFTIHVTGLVFANQDNNSPITKVKISKENFWDQFLIFENFPKGSQGSSPCPMPGIQAGQIRRDVHGKFLITFYLKIVTFLTVDFVQYKVPTGCIVVNNPSVLASRAISTPAPRYSFDWDYAGSSSSSGGDSSSFHQEPPSRSPNGKLIDSGSIGAHRLRDAAIPSAPVILPGPSWHPSMGGQPLRLSNSRGNSGRIQSGSSTVKDVQTG